MKSFARYFLFGLAAASLPAAVCMLFTETMLGVPRHIAGAIAIFCAQAAYFYFHFSRRSRRRKSEPPAAAKPRAQIYGKITGCIAGFACIAFLFFKALLHILELPTDAGPFDRAKMEALVAQVRNLKFSGDGKFYWTDVSGTPALTTTAGAESPNLWADRTGDKNLKVIIWTNGARHHSLVCGFAYSDVPLAPDGTPRDTAIFFSSGPDTTIAHPAAAAFDVPGLHLIKQIDAHWWAVNDNSWD